LNDFFSLKTFCRQEDIDSQNAFSRDGMGRKSMSEKRKKQFDPRVTSFYQQLQQSKGCFCFTCTHHLFISSKLRTDSWSDWYL